MDKHLQTLVGAQVKVGVAVNATGIPGIQIIYRQLHGLLIALNNLGLTAIDDAGLTGRQNIVDRLARGIGLNIDLVNADATVCRTVTTRIQVKLVVAPFALHEFERCKAQVGLILKAPHEHSHETDCGEVLNRANLLLIVEQGNRELVPGNLLRNAIAREHISDMNVGNVVLADYHRIGMDSHAILEIVLIIIQGIILVDILNIGSGPRCLILSVARIAL